MSAAMAAPSDGDALTRLVSLIAQSGGAVVAFSGGVDSSVVAAAAHRALGERAVAITAVSPSLAEGELDGARRVAEAIGIRHETIATRELDREGYRVNDRDRCFHCKTELYGRLVEVARSRGSDAVYSGTNADDLGDWRPGLRAASDFGVRHPLLELGIGKASTRAIARALGLPSADKPAAPCLASRVPYGTVVDAGTLAQIDRAERGVRALGFEIVRVRHFGDEGRVEIGDDELIRALVEPARTAILRAVTNAGYATATIDERPFRSGSLNAIGRPIPLSPATR
ncbi:MAG TPA: ATP-dependent sacrificial sulfur transferase LarE [Actinomycetota bacterium]|nr:ATP-dependent sacrificial sulfur transferase LarE [Actinomycetota bacterium]